MQQRAAFLAGILALAAAEAAAQRDAAEEAKIHEALAARSSAAVPLFQEATEAMDEAESPRAVEGFRRVLELAPDFVPALRRLSFVTKDDAESLALARRAYALDAHGYNLTAVVQALLRSTEGAKLKEAEKHALHLMELLPDEPGALAIVSFAAIRNENLVLLEHSNESLRRVAPDDIVTHYVNGIEAALRSDWERAETEIERARELGLPDEEADALLAGAGITSHARNWRYVRGAGHASLVWAFGLVLLTGLGVVLSRLTLSRIDAQTPEVTGHPEGSVRRMRHIYRVVLSLASVYFYLSIPFVFLLVVGAALGLVYAIVAIGYVPIKLVVIALILMVVTIWSMLKGLFARGNDGDPGHRLSETDAPALFAVLREVAGKLGTPEVDSVFALPDATVAVFERGSTLDHLRHRGERCLLLGLGVLDGMTVSELKGVLAHEYGHLSNRDTAGGALALQVRRSIVASAEGLARGGAAVWYNPAWLFLNLFYRLYLRISQGASRLQEVLADRWAVLAYGKKPFSDGLRHAVRRGIEFDFLINREIGHALRESRPLRNLYALRMPPQWSPDDESPSDGRGPADLVEQAYEEALSAPPSPYDSHPPAAQRIAWVDKLTSVPEPPADETPAWSLIAERQKLQELMTTQLNARIRAFVARQQELRQVRAEADDDEVTSLGLSSR